MPDKSMGRGIVEGGEGEVCGYEVEKSSRCTEHKKLEVTSTAGRIRAPCRTDIRVWCGHHRQAHRSPRITTSSLHLIC